MDRIAHYKEVVSRLESSLEEARKDCAAHPHCAAQYEVYKSLVAALSDNRRYLEEAERASKEK